MAIALLEANLKDAAGTPEGVQAFEQMYNGLEQKPQFAFLSEAYREDQGLNLGLLTFAAKNGLVLYTGLYRDRESVKDRHGWVALAAAHLVVNAETICMGTAAERAKQVGRTAIKVSMRDEETNQLIDIVGAHLSDRDPKLNEQQGAALILQTRPERPTAFVLQTNSMRNWGARPALLRLAGRALRHAPQADPGTLAPVSSRSPEGRKWVLARTASLAARLGGMAQGRSYNLLKRAGFKSDSPILQRSTVYVAGVPAGKIDHLFAWNAQIRSRRPVKNIVTPTMNGLRRVPHRVTVGEVYIPSSETA